MTTRSVDTARLVEQADVLTRAGEEMVAGSSMAAEAVSAVPDDIHGLHEMLSTFDEARRRFDERVGRVLAQAGGRLANQAANAAAADSGAEFAHLPKAGR